MKEREIVPLIRPEAAAGFRLIQEQENARVGVQDLFEAWARRAQEVRHSKPHFPPALPWLGDVEQVRHAQVALIDGARGTGKTSVLLRLRHDWEQRLREPDPGQTWSVIPLPILDLQPLPSDAPLMPGIVLGLFKPVHEYALGDEDTSEPSRRAFLPAWSAPEVDPLQSRWDAVFRAVASWSGHTQERRRNLEEEVYWRELRDETVRVTDLATAYRNYIDILAATWRDRRSKTRAEPLFAVLIDDADMNPHRSVDLLELLRTLYHPNVAFVLTGDSVLFDLKLRERYTKALRAPADEHDVHELQQLTRDMFDRIIPPRQRMKIDLNGSEKWPDYPAQRADAPDPTPEQPHLCLRRLLARIQMSPTNEASLASYFDAADDVNGGVSVRSCLPDRLRRANDLLPFFERAADKAMGASVLYFWWQKAVDWWSPSQAIAKQLKSLVQLQHDDAGTPQLIVDPDDELSWAQRKRPVLVSIPATGVSVQATPLAGWTAQLRESKAPLPARLSNLLMMMGDTVLTPADAGRRDGEALRPELLECVHTRWETGPGEAVSSLAWPMPHWTRYLTVLRFAALFRRGLMGPQPLTQSALLQHLINSVLDAARDGDLRTSSHKPLDWRGIAAQLQHDPRESDQPDLRRSYDWLQRDALGFLAPEYGIPDDHVRTVLELMFKDEPASKSLREELEEQRPRRIAGLRSRLRNQIRNRSNRSIWGHFLRTGQADLGAFGKLCDDWRALTWFPLHEQFVPGPTSLFGYIDTPLRQALLLSVMESPTLAPRMAQFTRMLAEDYRVHDMKSVEELFSIETSNHAVSFETVEIDPANPALPADIFEDYTPRHAYAALLRLVQSDLTCDLRDSGSGSPLWKYPHRVHVADALSWPLPSFDAPLDQELLWNEVVSLSSGAAKERGSERDAFASALVRLVSEVTLTRTNTNYLSRSSEPSDWADMLRRIIDALPTSSPVPRRAQSIQDWIVELVSFATPAGGLTAPARATVADALDEVGSAFKPLRIALERALPKARAVRKAAVPTQRTISNVRQKKRVR